MNSEKVKEIKKALADCSSFPANCGDCSYFGILDCNTDMLLKDILTLINELESENEKLNKALVDNLEAYKDGFNEGAGLKKKVDDKLKTENQQLKDRIAELEKQMCKNEDLHNATEKLNDMIILKQFAERLKEEAFTVFMGEPIVRGSKIDETLKEFISLNTKRKKGENSNVKYKTSTWND